MKTLFTLLLLMFPFSGALGQVPDFSKIVGTYEGEVFNGDDLDPITTIFRLGPEGTLTGGYTVGEETGTYQGTLSNAMLDDNNVLTAEWTDKFGEGFLQLQFSNNFRRFSGFWSNLDNDEQLPWSGEKK